MSIYEKKYKKKLTCHKKYGSKNYNKLFFTKNVVHLQLKACCFLYKLILIILNYFFSGRSAGTFGGGMLMNITGQKIAYRLIATGCLASVIMYIIFIFFRQKRRHS